MCESEYKFCLKIAKVYIWYVICLHLNGNSESMNKEEMISSICGNALYINSGYLILEACMMSI